VIALSKLAMSDQCHDGITSWHASQVEGLVALTGSAGSSPVSGNAKTPIIVGVFRFPDGERTIQAHHSKCIAKGNLRWHDKANRGFVRPQTLGISRLKARKYRWAFKAQRTNSKR